MKSSILILMAVCMSIGIAFGDYANPPGWENDENFTHQSWSFDGPANPMAPDDGWVNPNGPATMTFSNATWEDDLEMVYDAATFDPLGVRQGGWAISGTQDNTEWFSIDIPNQANPDFYKELWFEMTFRVSSQALALDILNRVDLSVYANGDIAQSFNAVGQDGGVFGATPTGEVWLRFEGLFTFDPQPASELIVLTGSLLANESVLLDQIDIDTRCVPEPASISLLGIGVLGLIRRRKNR